MVAAVLPIASINQHLPPYIQVQVETLDKTETALIDSGSCYNVINYEFLQTLKAVPLRIKETPMSGLFGDILYFMGTVQLKIQVGLLSCPDEFFFMPPNGMVLAMILGTPWQRKYIASPHWDTNSIHFQQADGYVSQPFASIGGTGSLPQHKVVTNKGKQKIVSGHGYSATKSKPRATQTRTVTGITTKQSSQYHNINDTIPHKCWVEKRLVHTQAGRAQIWVPSKERRHLHNTKKGPQFQRIIDGQTYSRSHQEQRTRTVQPRTIQRWIPKRIYHAQQG